MINLPLPSCLQRLSAESRGAAAHLLTLQQTPARGRNPLRLIGAPLNKHPGTPSDKRGLQFAPVHLPPAFALLQVPLGFDHGGKVRRQVHRRPGPPAAAAQLQGHALPLLLPVRTLRTSRVPGASAGLPGALGADRSRDVVQVQRRFGVGAAGSGRGRLGFAAGAKRRPRQRR